MIDEDIRQLLQDAAPPLKPPADRLHAIGRRVRRQRLRLVAVGTAGAVAMVASSLGLLSMLPLRSGVSSTAVGAPSHSTPATIASTSTQPGRDSQLSDLAVTALHAAAPEATAHGRIITQHTTVGAGNFVGSQVGLLITAGGRSGALTVAIEHRDGDVNTCAAQASGPALGSCRDLTGPHGEKIVSIPTTGDGSTNGRPNRATVVRVARGDGTTVMVMCSNATRLSVPGGQDSYGFNTTAYTGMLPPLTLDEVTSIALDPSLTLNP